MAGVSDDDPEDPRIDAVVEHFVDWHGIAPDRMEIEALLERIDAATPRGIG